MTTHEDQAVARIPDAWLDDDLLQNLIRVLAAPADRMQSEIEAMRGAFVVESAIGPQLDAVGDWVGIAREGRDDATYRMWIRAQVLVLRGSARAEDLAAVLELVTPDATLRSVADASLYVRLFAAPAVRRDQVHAILVRAKAAGVRLDYEGSEYSPDSLFTFDATGLGWGDTASPSVGGRLTDLLSS